MQYIKRYKYPITIKIAFKFSKFGAIINLQETCIINLNTPISISTIYDQHDYDFINSVSNILIGKHYYDSDGNLIENNENILTKNWCNYVIFLHLCINNYVLN